MKRCLALLAVVALVTACEGGASDPRAANEVRLTTTIGGLFVDLTWVAAKDGDAGAWTRLSGSGGVYKFVAASGRYTLALVCATMGRAEIIQATTSELPDVSFACGDETAVPLVRRTGAIRGVPAGARPIVTFGLPAFGALPARIATDNLSYTITLPAGTYDWAAVDGGPSPRVLVGRGLSIAGEGATDIDFAMGARSTIAREVVVSGAVPEERLSTVVQLITVGDAVAPFSGERTARFVAAAELTAGETQALRIDASNTRGASRGISMGLAGEPPAIELPPPLAPTSVTAPNTGTLRLPQAKLMPYPCASFYQLATVLLETLPSLDWVLNVGAGWLGTGDTISMPDLSTAPGFDPQWGPLRTGRYFVGITAATSTLSLARTLDGRIPRNTSNWKVTYASGAPTLLAP